MHVNKKTNLSPASFWAAAALLGDPRTQIAWDEDQVVKAGRALGKTRSTAPQAPVPSLSERRKQAKAERATQVQKAELGQRKQARQAARQAIAEAHATHDSQMALLSKITYDELLAAKDKLDAVVNEWAVKEAELKASLVGKSGRDHMRPLRRFHADKQVALQAAQIEYETAREKAYDFYRVNAEQYGEDLAQIIGLNEEVAK